MDKYEAWKIVREAANEKGERLEELVHDGDESSIEPLARLDDAIELLNKELASG